MGRAPALIGLGLGFALAACDGTSDHLDAGAADADLVSFPFTGTYLDWDSTAAAPCPIAGATWTARYDDTRVATTDDAGRFTMSLASYTPLLDVAPPAAPSACAGGSYQLRALAIAPPAVVLAGGTFTARAFTPARAATFYASFGAAFDLAHGNVLVHVNGAPRELSISSAHDPAQIFDGAVWAAGATGADVMFPNIELGGGATAMTTVSVAGGNALGLGSVPLEPGTITYMAVILR